MLTLFVCLYWLICHVTQSCFHMVRELHAVSTCPFPVKEDDSGSFSEGKQMIFKKVLLSRTPISLKWLLRYSVLTTLRSMNGGLVAQTRENVINSTALYEGRQPVQKCLLRMADICVFWAPASYLWPLSSLNLPFLITCSFFSSSHLTSYPCSLTDG